MSSGDTIFYMIICCVAFIAVMFFSKPLAKIFRILVQGIIGAVGMYVLNIILLPLNVSVGVNLLTVIYVGILGFPGFISLYALSLIL